MPPSVAVKGYSDAEAHVKGKPILNRLDRERIFSVDDKLAQGHLVRFWDACDGFFYLDLTRDEVRQLAAELRAIAAEADKEISVT